MNKYTDLYRLGYEDGRAGRPDKKPTTSADDQRAYGNGYADGVKAKDWQPGGVSTRGYHPGGVPDRGNFPDG